MHHESSTAVYRFVRPCSNLLDWNPDRSCCQPFGSLCSSIYSHCHYSAFEPMLVHRWFRRRSAANQVSFSWYCRINSILFSGVASARKSSTPASAAPRCGQRVVSPVIMIVLIPIFRISAKFSQANCFDDVLQIDDPHDLAIFDNYQRGAPRVRHFGYDLVTLWWVGTATSEHIFLIVSAAPFYEFDRHDNHAAHPCFGTKIDKFTSGCSKARSRIPNFSFGQNNNTAAFCRFVS